MCVAVCCSHVSYTHSNRSHPILTPHTSYTHISKHQTQRLHRQSQTQVTAPFPATCCQLGVLLRLSQRAKVFCPLWKRAMTSLAGLDTHTHVYKCTRVHTHAHTHTHTYTHTHTLTHTHDHTRTHTRTHTHTCYTAKYNSVFATCTHTF